MRRRLQVSLRALILLVTVCAIALGIIVKKVRDTSRQRTVVQVLESNGASVHYSDASMFGRKVDIPKPLMKFFGRDFWTEPDVVTGDDLSGLRLNGELTGSLRRLPQVACVYVDTPIENGQLARLSSMPNLSFIFLFGLITPEDLAQLHSLPRIDGLCMYPTHFSKKQARELARIPNLKFLAIFNAEIDAGAFSVMRQLTQLEDMRLTGSRFSEMGLLDICKMTQLRRLYIDDIQFTDEEVPYIVDLVNLEELWLPDVSDESAAQLQASLPNCYIIR